MPVESCAGWAAVAELKYARAPSPAPVGLQDRWERAAVVREVARKTRRNPLRARRIPGLRCRHDLHPVPVRPVTEPVRFVETVAFDHIPAPAFPGVTRRGDDGVSAGAGRQFQIADRGEVAWRRAGFDVLAGRCVGASAIAGDIQRRPGRQRSQ